MFSEGDICPYVKKCRKFLDGNCHKVERYKECGNYDDFKWEFFGNHEDKTKDIVEKLSKLNKIKQKIEKVSENKSKKKLEKCRYELNCQLIFKEECDKRRLNYECDMTCEDCDLNIPDLGLYCKTDEYEKCESYELISNLREEYESIGVYNTKDLKAHFGEENYEWLGGYIRCAFMDPEDIREERRRERKERRGKKRRRRSFIINFVLFLNFLIPHYKKIRFPKG